MKRDLTKPQETMLLRKHLVGDFGTHSWPSIRVLINKGYLETEGKYLMVTPRGRQYCDAYHVDIKL